MNPFVKHKHKLKQQEIDAAITKIRDEYDKYIVTFHKAMTLKVSFERRYTEARIHSVDMERFLSEEIVAVKSLFVHQKKIDDGKNAEAERERLKQLRKSRPDFADKILKQLKDKVMVYPSLKFHEDASYEIIHLYGAIQFFEQQHWPALDHFISEHQSWALRGEKKDFNNELWRFLPSGENHIPVELERYCILLNSTNIPLNEISAEARQCLKKAAFLLNDIVWSCNTIISKGIDSTLIEQNLNFVQTLIEDFRIKDLKNR